ARPRLRGGGAHRLAGGLLPPRHRLARHCARKSLKATPCLEPRPAEPLINLGWLTCLVIVERTPKSTGEATPLQQRGREYVRRLRGETSVPRPRQLRDGPRIGVALGGGSARGLTHIPYIEAMDELGLKPAVIAGTSIGALIGAG